MSLDIKPCRNYAVSSPEISKNLEKEFNIKKSSFINKVIYILFIINLYNNNL